MKHLKTVDWPTLREWCLAHGAKNDAITSIRIDGVAPKFNVILEGHELVGGRKFLESRTVPAAWRTVEPLRFLP